MGLHLTPALGGHLLCPDSEWKKYSVYTLDPNSLIYKHIYANQD